MSSDELFDFYVIVREQDLSLTLKKIPSDQSVQRNLTTVFTNQLQTFLNIDTEHRAFDPSFTPKKNDMFEAKDFELPECYPQTLVTPETFEDLKWKVKTLGPIVKAVVAVDNENQSFYFQQFANRHVLDTKRTMFLSGYNFQMLKQHAVQIDNKLTAVFRDGNLYFKSLYAVRQFLPMDGLFRDATKEDIRQALSSKLFHVDDMDAVIDGLSDRSRKKFSIIMASKILEHKEATPKRIKETSAKFRGIEIELKQVKGKHRIVFPEKPRQIEYLLRFLAEDFYTSPLTQQPRATNSHESYKPVA